MNGLLGAISKLYHGRLVPLLVHNFVPFVPSWLAP